MLIGRFSYNLQSCKNKPQLINSKVTLQFKHATSATLGRIAYQYFLSNAFSFSLLSATIYLHLKVCVICTFFSLCFEKEKKK